MTDETDVGKTPDTNSDGAQRKNTTASSADCIDRLVSTIEDHGDEIGEALAAHCDGVVTEGEVADLRAETQELREENERLRERVDDLERETMILKSRADGASSLIDNLEDSVSELQSRELEKGAHFRYENIDEDKVSIADGRLERITKEDGHKYYRLPGEEDALERGGAVTHSTTDLLPIQRLSRYDDDMLASVTNCQPDELAAKAWRQRSETGRYELWSKGSKNVRVYLNSSDLADWIRQQRAGVSKKYSQELARRTMDAMLDLANGKLGNVQKTRRKDGLQYKERRIVLHRDTDLPGEVGPSAESDASPATSEGAGA